MINIINISKSFEGQQIFKNASLCIKFNGLYLLKGKNGSGKTTLLNLISKDLPLDSGEIKIDGDISSLKISNNLIDDFSVFENLKLICNNDDIIIDNLKKWNMLEFKNKIINKLSNGEKERISIIKAIISNSKYLLLDEPDSVLDDKNIDILFDVLNNLKKKKIIVVVSHKLSHLNIYDGIITIENHLLKLNVIKELNTNDKNIEKQFFNKELFCKLFFKYNIFKYILVMFISLFCTIGIIISTNYIFTPTCELVDNAYSTNNLNFIDSQSSKQDIIEKYNINSNEIFIFNKSFYLNQNNKKEYYNFLITNKSSIKINNIVYDLSNKKAIIDTQKNLQINKDYDFSTPFLNKTTLNISYKIPLSKMKTTSTIDCIISLQSINVETGFYLDNTSIFNKVNSLINNQIYDIRYSNISSKINEFTLLVNKNYYTNNFDQLFNEKIKGKSFYLNKSNIGFNFNTYFDEITIANYRLDDNLYFNYSLECSLELYNELNKSILMDSILSSSDDSFTFSKEAIVKNNLYEKKILFSINNNTADLFLSNRNNFYFYNIIIILISTIIFFSVNISFNILIKKKFTNYYNILRKKHNNYLLIFNVISLLIIYMISIIIIFSIRPLINNFLFYQIDKPLVPFNFENFTIMSLLISLIIIYFPSLFLLKIKDKR